jgi:AcrR family transcriptional regulator
MPAAISPIRDAVAKPKPGAPKPRLTRAEKAEATRTRLFEAAIGIVGEMGYAAASVALITARANVAQGTFYNYFESRQDLLDQLLPSLSLRLHALIRQRVMEAPDDAIEREKARLAGSSSSSRKSRICSRSSARARSRRRKDSGPISRCSRRATGARSNTSAAAAIS